MERFIKTARAGLAPAALAVLALVVAACSATPPSLTPQAALPSAPKSADVSDMSPAVLHEHQRILGAYGGIYNDPKLQGLLEKTVDRLVGASEHPDLRYKVVILNSQSINAFALPSGQLYVTRGLIALANDESELASVLAHEMGHVIARHAAIREEQARQAALVGRVVTDVISDPEVGALALAKSKRAPSASASLRAPATIRTARCASSPPWNTIRSLSPGKPATRRLTRAHPTY